MTFLYFSGGGKRGREERGFGCQSKKGIICSGLRMGMQRNHKAVGNVLIRVVIAARNVLRRLRSLDSGRRLSK